ncbi:hypothetical protein L873DRAFT_13303 [Choiromyces venosus 120613-1]|uniref:Uncharacterized protein n=1 Tax=Choiromyces venosus 120613-1 TaxID=1336337 RepID=A0A3N4K9H1_9PEZI|nr:hypothetical protein L873DRAFT_13303 [Choiromyces venosus 120613-1]
MPAYPPTYLSTYLSTCDCDSNGTFLGKGPQLAFSHDTSLAFDWKHEEEGESGKEFSSRWFAISKTYALYLLSVICLMVLAGAASPRDRSPKWAFPASVTVLELFVFLPLTFSWSLT